MGQPSAAGKTLICGQQTLEGVSEKVHVPDWLYPMSLTGTVR